MGLISDGVVEKVWKSAGHVGMETVAHILTAYHRILAEREPSDEEVERIAEIMWNDVSERPGYWQHVEPTTQDIYRSNARAAIKALWRKG